VLPFAAKKSGSFPESVKRQYAPGGEQIRPWTRSDSYSKKLRPVIFFPAGTDSGQAATLTGY